MAIHPIVLVTGKGGVGKSSVSAGLAVGYARAGRRTLLVEFGEESYFQYFFSLSHLDFQPVDLGADWHGMHVARWDGSHCLRDYVAHTLKMKKLTDLFFENAAMKAFVNAAPALADVSLLGKLTSGVRQVGPPFPYDVVVVDSYAAGHMMSLVRAPRGLAEAVRVGPMGEQCRDILQVLQDSSLCRFAIVSLPEELPVTETLELFADLEQEIGHPPEVILNRVLPEVALAEISAEFKQDRRKFVEYLQAVYERQGASRQRLKNAAPDLLEVPQSFESSVHAMTLMMADHLRRWTDE